MTEPKQHRADHPIRQSPAAPSPQEQFDEQTSRRIESVYLSPDIVAQRSKILALLAPCVGENALDIGCGPGLTTLALAQAVGLSGSVQGVDIAEPMLSIARQRCAAMPQASFALCDVTALPQADASFDVALATQVYEYVDDIDLALTELARVLRPGGRALLVDTDWESAVWASGDNARMRRVLDAWNEHIPHPQLPRTLAGRMARAGFKNLRVEIVPILNLAFDPDTYSIGMMEVIAPFVAGRAGLSAADVAAWKQDVCTMDSRGGTFFSLNRYVFVAER